MKETDGEKTKQFINPPTARIFKKIFVLINIVKNPKNPETTTIIVHHSIFGVGI